LQSSFMNILISIEFSSNQLLYDFNIKNALHLITFHDTQISSFVQESIRDISRKDSVDAIDFVNVRLKYICDSKHKPIAFNVDDKVFLRLHHEYSLLERGNSKLSNQRADSFVMKKKVEALTYELDLSVTFKIHLVIFVAQLESTPEDDLFDRLKSNHSGLIYIEEDIKLKQSYEMKQILKKRSRKFEKFMTIQYFVK
jgi:hypothetical protein